MLSLAYKECLTRNKFTRRYSNIFKRFPVPYKLCDKTKTELQRLTILVL